MSYSSRIVAAMRAIEDEEPDKLFDDPLARVLAGDKAIKRAHRVLKVRCHLVVLHAIPTALTALHVKAAWLINPSPNRHVISVQHRLHHGGGRRSAWAQMHPELTLGPGLYLQDADVLPGTVFAGSPLPRRVRRLTRTVIRTRWFDDSLLAALSPAAHPRPIAAQLREAAEGGVRLELRPSGAPIRQVVLLGAGMDSRAWRLPLPPGADSGPP